MSGIPKLNDCLSSDIDDMSLYVAISFTEWIVCGVHEMLLGQLHMM